MLKGEVSLPVKTGTGSSNSILILLFYQRPYHDISDNESVMTISPMLRVAGLLISFGSAKRKAKHPGAGVSFAMPSLLRRKD